MRNVIVKLFKCIAMDAVYFFFAVGIVLYAVFFIGDEEVADT